MKTYYLLLSLVLVTSAQALEPADSELTLMTGREASIDYKMGKDLQRLLLKHDIDLNVIPSMGSVENIVKVYEFPSIQLGIAQLDTLTFPSLHALVRQFGITSELQNIVSNMQLVLPLYRETVHLLTSQNIKNINQLNGKRIAIGRRSSSTHGTALNLLRMFSIKPEKILAIDLPRALQLMQADKLDALFHVAALPDPQLQHAVADNLHLLPIDLTQAQDKQLLQHLYESIQISADDYVWQTHSITSIAVRNILVTADTGECQAVGKMAAIIEANLTWLQKNGHKKWREVQFDKTRLLKHRSLSPCVKQALTDH